MLYLMDNSNHVENKESSSCCHNNFKHQRWNDNNYHSLTSRRRNTKGSLLSVYVLSVYYVCWNITTIITTNKICSKYSRNGCVLAFDINATSGDDQDILMLGDNHSLDTIIGDDQDIVGDHSLDSITSGGDNSDLDQDQEEIQVGTAIDDDDDIVVVDHKIYGGEFAPIGSYPFHVIPGLGSMYNCGGTLIWDDIVLTAAHCAKAFLSSSSGGQQQAQQEQQLGGSYNIANTNTASAVAPSVRTVCLGGNDIACENTRGTYSISKLIKHPKYNVSNAYHDIMLIKLSTLAPGPFVTLNYNPNIPKVNDTVTTIGYGIDTSGFSTYFLKHVNTTTLSDEECRKISYRKYNHTIDQGRYVLCTTSRIRGASPCGGDSGGPVLLPGITRKGAIQVGITSYVYKQINETGSITTTTCGKRNTPIGNIRISGYEEWIKETICTVSDNKPEYCVNEMKIYLANTDNNTIYYKNGQIQKQQQQNRKEEKGTTNIFSRSQFGTNLTIVAEANYTTTRAQFMWPSNTNHSNTSLSSFSSYERPFLMSGDIDSNQNTFIRNRYVSNEIGLKKIHIKLYKNKIVQGIETYSFEIVD